MTKYSSNHNGKKKHVNFLTLKDLFGIKNKQENTICKQTKIEPKIKRQPTINSKIINKQYKNTQLLITKYFEEKAMIQQKAQTTQHHQNNKVIIPQHKFKPHVLMIEQNTQQLSGEEQMIIQLEKQKERLLLQREQLRNEKANNMIQFINWEQNYKDIMIEFIQTLRQNNRKCRSFKKTQSGTIHANEDRFDYIDSQIFIEIKIHLLDIQKQLQNIDIQIQKAQELQYEHKQSQSLTSQSQQLFNLNKQNQITSLIAKKQNLNNKHQQILIKHKQLYILKRQSIRKYKLSLKQQKCQLNQHNWKMLNENIIPIQLIGVGGFSEVYKCYDIKKETYAVLKIPKPNKSSTDEELEIFEKQLIDEYEIQKQLNHPNIGVVYSRFILDNQNYFYNLFEYYEGPQLSDYIQHLGHLQQKQAKAILKQVLLGIQYLHDNRIIHFDIKSKNIMFHHKNIKIIDFGISKKIRQGETKIRLDNQGYGTYSCLPSQVILDPDNITYKVDIYSIGVLFYQMLYEKKPFNFGSYYQAMNTMTDPQYTNIKFPCIEKWHQNISQQAQSLILHCLSYQAQNRPTAKQVLNSQYFNDIALS